MLQDVATKRLGSLHTKFRRIMLMDTAEVEHKRWNAYMRTEGYQYSGSTQEISRNDLGKLHHDLVRLLCWMMMRKRRMSRKEMLNDDHRIF